MPASRGGGRRREGVAALPGSIADATIALRRKRYRRRRRTLLRVAVGLLVLALVAGMGWLVGFSQMLAAKHVDVKGTHVLTSEQVLKGAAVPLGTPLARLSTDDIAERVRAMRPVKDVEVDRDWPNGVVISVTERTPVMQVKRAGGFEWADADGTVFHEQAATRADLMLVEAGESPRILKDVAVVIGSLTPQLREQLSAIQADSPDAITLQLKGGRTVIWGSSAESQTKAQVATALLTVKATVYDVSSPANPTSR